MTALDLDALQAAASENAIKKTAFRLYKKHVTGRGYVWPAECSMPDDVQRAISEGMSQQAKTIFALVDRLRKAEDYLKFVRDEWVDAQFSAAPTSADSEGESNG